MSNNIYDILKKMQNLETPKQSLTEGKKAVKPDFLDIDKDGDKTEPMKQAAKKKSTGAVAEAVAQVEKQLNEKYMGFKKNAAAGKKMGEELDPKYKSPNVDIAVRSHLDTRDRLEKQGVPYSPSHPDPAGIAMRKDQEGQDTYKSRSSGGVINKVKDFVGYNKPDPAYGPKDMKEGEQGVAEGAYNEDMMSPKQKKFAKLAPPPDKITYADKIAGAKKKDQSMAEGWDEMQQYLEKKRGPESRGDAGKKAGTRYGGSAQKDEVETDGEGQAVVKKKGRPKGTGGGAKFSFKKPKD